MSIFLVAVAVLVVAMCVALNRGPKDVWRVLKTMINKVRDRL